METEVPPFVWKEQPSTVRLHTDRLKGGVICTVIKARTVCCRFEFAIVARYDEAVLGQIADAKIGVFILDEISSAL